LELSYSFRLKNPIDLAIKIAKIVVISYCAVYVIGNFIPYYEGDDAYVFGATALNLAEGKYSITNDLLQETGFWEFVPLHWIKTVDNHSVPGIAGVGFPAILTISYIAAGYYGLFYAGPIISVIFLIAAERISTKLVNKETGLFVLLLFATNSWFLKTSLHAMSDIAFSLFVAIGAYYLVQAVQTKNQKKLFFSTIFFVIASFIRVTGIVAFPIEILVILYLFKRSKNNHKTKNFSHPVVYLLALLPWLMFFAFFLSYNSLYFGDPLQTYLDQSQNRIIQDETLQFEVNYANNLKGYFRSILPFPLSTDLNDIPEQYNNVLGKYWIGFFAIFALILAIYWSLKNGKHRKTVFIFTLFILGIFSFYSILSAESALERAISRRFMIPIYLMFFTILGIILKQIIDYLSHEKITHKILKFTLVSVVGVFLIASFFVSSPVETMKTNNFKFQNPADFTKRYPLDHEGLTNDDILLDSKGYITPEYGLIPFTAPTSNSLNSAQTEQSINLLKELLNENHDVYVLKEPSRPIDKKFFNHLDKNGFSFIEYSKSFCKVTIDDSVQSDNICL